MQMVVFDFDKTLTDVDTLFGFYKEVDGNNRLFTLKRYGLLLGALAYKSRLISNNRLKSWGIQLFLAGKPKQQIERAAEKYAKKIKLNSIFENNYLLFSRAERWIISASLEVYLTQLFPNDKVVGSTLQYKNGVVVGLKTNMYGRQKASYLKSIGVEQIDQLFTDSFSDKPLMEMAREVVLVKNSQVERVLMLQG